MRATTVIFSIYRCLSRWMLLLLVSFGWVALVRAQSDPVAQSLQSVFIWRGVTETSAAYTVFRKSFSAADVSGARLHLFADARYVVWINGRYVARGPCRFDPDGPEYDTHDVTAFLSSGSNTIVVMVMSFPSGSATSGKMIRHAPGLTALLTAGSGPSAVSVATDATWKWKTGLRYKAPGIGWGIINDTVDARLDDGDWTQTNYVAAAWTASAGISGTQWGTLRARSTPLLLEQDVAVSGAAFPLTLTGSNVFYFTLPRMVQGYVELDVVSAVAGSSLKLEVGEKGSASSISSTYGSAFNVTVSTNRLKCFTTDSMGFRYLRITNTSGTLTLHGIRVVDRRYPYVDAGSFHSSDAWLNDLWGRAVHTLRMCSDDGYMDCTLRERAEWLGDAAVVEYPVSRVTLAGPAMSGQPLHSDSGLMASMIRHVAQSTNQYNDGRLKAHVPSDRNDIHGYIEDYSCLWVQTVRQVYENTGDTNLIREIWPALTGQVKWFLDRRSAARGLVSAREFVIFDNPLKYLTCEGATLNAFVYRALLDAAVLGAAIGKTNEAASYQSAAAALQTNFNNYLWDAANGTYFGGLTSNGAVVSTNSGGSAILPTSTAHAAMLALDRGIVPSNRVASVRNYFLSRYNAAVSYPYTAFWALENLYAMDDPVRDAEALSYIRSRWTTMMNITDTGTFTESFSGGEPCHNFGASAAYFLSAYGLGVRLDGPAARGKLLIEPRPGNLPAAQGNVVTELGVVPVSWSAGAGAFNLDCTIPAGATATVHVPQIIAGRFPAVALDGVVTNAPRAGRYVVLTVGPGAHSVRATNQLTWKGDGSANLWNMTATNWLDDQGLPVTFATNSAVIFNDAGRPTVVLSGILAPAAITINSTQNYVFSGGGSLGGAATLIKSGSGSLTLSTTNGHTGSATLNAGTVMLGNASALGAGGAVVFNGGSLAFAAGFAFYNPGQIAGAHPAMFDTRGNEVTYCGALAATGAAAGGLLKSGAGTLTLVGALNYVGPTTIAGGTLKLGALNFPSDIAGLLYRLDASQPGSPVLSGTNVSAWNDAAGSGRNFSQATVAKQPAYVANALNGKPVIRFNGGQQLLWSNSTAPREVFAVTTVKGGVDGNIGGFLGINGADTGLRLNSSPGSWAADSGSTTVNGVATTAYTANQPQVVHRYATPWGTWAATGFGQYFSGGGRYYNGDVAEVLVYGSVLSAADRTRLRDYLTAKWLGTGYVGAVVMLPTNTAVNLTAAGAALDLGGTNQTVASLSGVAGTLVLNHGVFTVGDATTTTFSGVINGTGSLIKQGAGTLILGGTNTYAGGTTVSGGTLVASASGVLGTGSLTVGFGATCALQNTGSAVADVADVRLNGAMNLAGGVSEIVARLFINGVEMPGGTWNVTRDPGHFTGAGNLIVAKSGVLPTPPRLTTPQMIGGQLQFQITGTPGLTYTVQASTNLVIWADLFTTNPTAMPFPWADTGATNWSRRFYRVVFTP